VLRALVAHDPPPAESLKTSRPKFHGADIAQHFPITIAIPTSMAELILVLT